MSLTDIQSESYTLSIFVIEVDRRPVLALQGKWHAEIERVIADADVRDQLSGMTSSGRPLCDRYSIFRIRMARPEERQIFYDNPASLLTSEGLLAVILSPLDGPVTLTG